MRKLQTVWGIPDQWLYGLGFIPSHHCSVYETINTGIAQSQAICLIVCCIYACNIWFLWYRVMDSCIWSGEGSLYSIHVGQRYRGPKWGDRNVKYVSWPYILIRDYFCANQGTWKLCVHWIVSSSPSFNWQHMSKTVTSQGGNVHLSLNFSSLISMTMPRASLSTLTVLPYLKMSRLAASLLRFMPLTVT